MAGVYRARRQFQPNVTAGLAVFAPADLRSKVISAAKFTEDNKENEALARSERNFATFVSFCLAANDGIFRACKRRFASIRVSPKPTKPIAIFTGNFHRQSG